MINLSDVVINQSYTEKEMKETKQKMYQYTLALAQYTMYIIHHRYM